MRFAAIIIFVCTALANAATYYVRTDGNNSNAGTANTSGGAWMTPQKAADTVVASDIVRIQAGTYAGGLNETTDGSSGNTITYVADGAVILNGYVELSGDFIRLIGVEVDRNLAGTPSQHGIRIFGATGCEVWNCTVREYLNVALYIDGTSTAANANIMIGCQTIGNFGTSGVDAGDVHTGVMGDDNLVAYIDEDTTANDFNNFAGDRNRWLNIYSRNPSTSSEGHPDQFQTGGAGLSGPIGGDYNLFDAMLYFDTGSAQDDHHWFNLESNGFDFDNILVRRGVVYNTGTGSGVFQDFHHIYFVHNNWVTAQRFSGGNTTAYSLFTHANTSDIRIHNNIFYEAWGISVTAPRAYLVDSGGTFTHSNNLVWDKEGGSPTWTGPVNTETGVVKADPLFTDYDNKNFWITGSSPAIGVAGALTTVSSASNTGTVFSVGDAGFFRGANTALPMYGGNLAKGDRITVGTDQLQIASISGNSITVTSSFTWANGDSVFLGLDTTPDIGSFPASATALTAATYAVNGNDYTVTPNGATRWVVFFQDGIPNTVDEASPFTATIASGVVTMKAYALYAQTTPVVTATEGGGGGGGITANSLTVTTLNVGTP